MITHSSVSTTRSASWDLESTTWLSLVQLSRLKKSGLVIGRPPAPPITWPRGQRSEGSERRSLTTTVPVGSTPELSKLRVLRTLLQGAGLWHGLNSSTVNRSSISKGMDSA